jgi:hypothetical protein
MPRRYESDGLVFEPGETPQCSYCRRTPSQEKLYETNVNGIIYCTRTPCRAKPGRECSVSQIKMKGGR